MPEKIAINIDIVNLQLKKIIFLNIFKKTFSPILQYNSYFNILSS